MKTFSLLLLLVLLATTSLMLLHSSTVSASSTTNYVMPWLCTERCNQTKAQVLLNIQSIIDHQHILSRVSFERYNLGPNATLVVNTDLTNPNPIIKSKAPHIKTVAMISSYPYPPQFVDWMRSVFQNAIPFLQTVLKHLEEDNIDGVNIDWEPTSTATAQDAADYANFLGMSYAFFSSHGKIMSVDVAGWSSIWNFTEISAALSKNLPPSNQAAAASSLPMICTMSTYTNNDATWMKQLDLAVRQIQNYRQMLVVGLETFPTTNIAYRFDNLKKRGLCRAAVWMVPLNTTWWNAIGDFVTNCVPQS